MVRPTSSICLHACTDLPSVLGVLLYEIWSGARLPYKGWSNLVVATYVGLGHRLPPVHGLPRAIYALMMQAWHPSLWERPTASAVSMTRLRDSLSLVVTVSTPLVVRGVVSIVMDISILMCVSIDEACLQILEKMHVLTSNEELRNDTHTTSVDALQNIYRTTHVRDQPTWL